MVRRRRDSTSTHWSAAKRVAISAVLLGVYAALLSLRIGQSCPRSTFLTTGGTPATSVKPRYPPDILAPVPT